MVRRVGLGNHGVFVGALCAVVVFSTVLLVEMVFVRKLTMPQRGVVLLTGLAITMGLYGLSVHEAGRHQNADFGSDSAPQ